MAKLKNKKIREMELDLRLLRDENQKLKNEVICLSQANDELMDELQHFRNNPIDVILSD